MTELQVQQKHGPELRFPEFIKEWSLHTFGELVDNKSKKYTPVVDERYVDIELDSIESNTGRLLKTYYSDSQKSQKNMFIEGDVLYSKLRPYLNKYYLADFTGVCTSEVWVLKPKKSNIINNLFLYSFIQTSRFSKITNKSSGSKMPRADWNLVENIKFMLPNVTEQQKIGNFFRKLDQQIEWEEKKLALLEEQKKGYMQKIFTQELRFKDENGNEYPKWEERKLGEIANFRRGSFPQPYGKKEWYDEENGEPFVQVYDVSKYMKLHNTTKQKISDLAKPKSVKAYTGDIVITLQGSIGRVAVLHYDAYIDRTLLIISSFNISVNKHFIKYVLYLIFLKEKEKAPGGTIKTITKAALTSFTADIPVLKEQQKIGSFFQKLDRRIELQSQKIEYLRTQKQGFLQKMFV